MSNVFHRIDSNHGRGESPEFSVTLGLCCVFPGAGGVCRHRYFLRMHQEQAENHSRVPDGQAGNDGRHFTLHCNVALHFYVVFIFISRGDNKPMHSTIILAHER